MVRRSFVACAGEFVFASMLLLCSARIGMQQGFLLSQPTNPSNRPLTLASVANPASRLQRAERLFLHFVVYILPTAWLLPPNVQTVECRALPAHDLNNERCLLV